MKSVLVSFKVMNLCLIFALTSLSTYALTPQKSSVLKPDLLWATAQSAYRNKQWFASREAAYELAAEPRVDSLAGKALLLYAAAHYREGQAQKALVALNNYLTLFPQGRYRAYAHLYRGLFLLRTGQTNEATEQLAKCIHTAPNKEILGLCESELKSLLSRIPPPSAYTSLLASLPSYSALSTTGSKSVSAPQVILLLPLSGPWADLGTSLLEGIQLGWEQRLSKKSREELSLRIIDDRGQPLYAVQTLAKILENEKVIAVLGPALSDVTLATALYMSSHYPQIPLLSPTATAQGLSSLGPSIFQTNVPTHLLGEGLGAYVARCLGFQQAMVMHSGNEYGLELERGFQLGLNKNNASILQTHVYTSGLEDYSIDFKTIRQALFPGLYLRQQQQSWVRPLLPTATEKNEWLTSKALEIPALFLAASNSHEAYVLASQSKYNRLKTRFLGSSAWQDNDFIRQYGPDIQGSLISAEYDYSDTSTLYRVFRDAYLQKFKKSPLKTATLGFDAAAFFAHAYNQGGSQNILEKFSQITELSGSRGRIQMNKNRYNEATVILEVKGRSLIRATCPQEKLAL